MMRHGAPFSANELPAAGGRVRGEDLAAAVDVARRLERFATDHRVEPTAAFSGRVMAAIEREPAPNPVLVFGLAVAGARPLRMIGALRDAWRVTLTGGRPAPIRAQAMALVLLVLLAVGSVAGIAGAAALQFLDRNATEPSPALPIVEPPSTEPTDTTEPDASPPTDDGPTVTAEPTETPAKSPEMTPKPTPKATAKPPRATPRPTPRPTPHETDRPSPSDEPSDSPSADPSPDGEPTPTPGDSSGSGGGLEGGVDGATTPDAGGSAPSPDTTSVDSPLANPPA